ncbi:hypothetical protein D6C87_06471 [Aureobasidium pullulans]|uniref:Carboxylic ester hydrolase n=1 Tax=Aureobasidium pullulans TaxID=5580 RepID=A0AB38LHT0_AURPU|nr:hypothetical protein D6C94_10309 [Aureobasidium pullulans]THZ40363.1 hypothetical protein D6C87_06471 [Aureobasidium pullulans]
MFSGHPAAEDFKELYAITALSLIFQSFLNLRTTALASGGASIKSSEDCLHLDIFTPSNPESVNLPVLLSIHGGGYTLGNGANAAAGSNFVNRSDGGMIFVTIQYRLGGYGFLSPDAIEEDGAPNAGLLDVRAVTEWVQRNIRTFGGDPSKITIWGGSAGGGAVANQLTMYGGQPSPPFRAAIAEYP